MPGELPRIYIVNANPLSRLWRLLKQTSIGCYEDDCFGIAKGVAYSGLLSLFPILTSIAAILLRVKAEVVSRTLAHLLFRAAPPGSEELIRTHFTVTGQRTGWLVVVATLLSALAAARAMIGLMEGFQAAYRLPSRPSGPEQRGMAALP